VNDPWVVLVTAAVALVLVAAQIVAPGWKFAHTEAYALVLVAAIFVLVAYALRSLRAPAWRSRFPALAAGGAALIAVTGLVSGLLGVDTDTIVRAPGTIEPLTDLGAAAVFPLVDGHGVERGDARLGLRRRGRAELEIAPNGRQLIGTALLWSQPHVAAYVEAYDPAGRRLTITQPTNPAFLSPVLQFGTSVAIAKQNVPADEFAVPSLHRHVTAIYIDAKTAQAMQAARLRGQNVVLFAVRDETAHNAHDALGFAANGSEAQVGGLRLRTWIGSYPQLVVGSAPLPAALWVGGLAIVAGFAGTFMQRRTA
jgi:hypothetical protein